MAVVQIPRASPNFNSTVPDPTISVPGSGNSTGSTTSGGITGAINAVSNVTNLFAGFTWGRVGAFILGVFLVGLGVWGLLGSGSKQTIVELGKGAVAG